MKSNAEKLHRVFSKYPVNSFRGYEDGMGSLAVLAVAAVYDLEYSVVWNWDNHVEIIRKPVTEEANILIGNLARMLKTMNIVNEHTILDALTLLELTK